MMLEEPLTWSLRRHIGFHKCKRYFLIHYLIPAATPLTSETEIFKDYLLMERKEMHQILHWSTAITKATHDAMQQTPDLSEDFLRYTTLKTLEKYTRLPSTEIQRILHLLNQNDWFLHIVGRSKNHLRTLKAENFEYIPYRNNSILLLPNVAFEQGSIAIMFKTTSSLSHYTPINHMLNFLYLQNKLAWNITQLRIRSLTLDFNHNSTGNWKEEMITQKEMGDLCSFFDESVKTLGINQTHEVIMETDYPCCTSPEICKGCIYQNWICKES